MHCNRPKMLSPIVSPTKCCDVHDTEVYHVPHIHPTHTTVHHHNIFKHVHTCPHTVSHVADTAHQHFDCCPGPMPFGMGPGMAPGMGMGPGMGMPTGMAPGMGMGPGMGMPTGMTPGMAPGMGMPPGMAPGMGMAPTRRPFI